MDTTVRRICILTGTRADYGLLRNLILEVENSYAAELLLVVSGTHLSAEHGMTSAEIVADGLTAAATIPVWSGDDTSEGAARDLGVAIGSYAQVLTRLRPDVVVVLGDRLEAFAMATAATVLSLPVAHIHGGELTEGAMDDALRHAITKLSYLHFTSTDEHRRRVIQLGEEPDRVFNLGAPIVDNVAGLTLLGPAELERLFSIRLIAPSALVTFHPASMDVLSPVELVREMLAAIEQTENLHLIITGTNSDVGSREVRQEISFFTSRLAERADYVESFGQLGYLSVMAQCAVVVGNSSSTVLEAPVLGVPSVLIGDRQAGRPLAASVLVPQGDRDSIMTALDEALSPEFRERARTVPTPFGSPGFARRAFAKLLEFDFTELQRKRFWNREEDLE